MVFETRSSMYDIYMYVCTTSSTTKKEEAGGGGGGMYLRINCTV